MSETKQILVGEGLFTAADKPNLIGTHCKSCGDHFFPKTFTCHNPNCKGKDIEEVLLSRKGKVTTYSVMSYPPPPPFVVPPDYKPIPVVVVELPEGINIIGMLEGCDPKDVKIGMEAELTTGVIYTTEKNEQMIGWKFKPA